MMNNQISFFTVVMQRITILIRFKGMGMSYRISRTNYMCMVKIDITGKVCQEEKKQKVPYDINGLNIQYLFLKNQNKCNFFFIAKK